MPHGFRSGMNSEMSVLLQMLIAMSVPLLCTEYFVLGGAGACPFKIGTSNYYAFLPLLWTPVR